MFNFFTKVEVEVEVVKDVEVVLYEVYTKNDTIVLNVIRLNIMLIDGNIINIKVLDKCQFLVDKNITDVEIIVTNILGL